MRHLIDYQSDSLRKNVYKATISKEMQDLTDPRYRDLRRPRVVIFYKNGDRNFKGKTMHITPHRYLTFQELLSDLTKSMNLPYGVRQIYTPLNGTRIRQIEDLKNGECYVCASFEAFRRIKYGGAPEGSTQKQIPSYLHTPGGGSENSGGAPYASYTSNGAYRNGMRATFPPTGRGMFGKQQAPPIMCQ